MLDDSGKMVETRRGTRQGCRFGGLLFSLLYAKALDDARAAVREAGVSIGFPTMGDAPLWAHQGRRVT